MTDPFDDLIEKTREKYRVSWEKSLEKFKRFCALQDEEFEWAIKHGKFYPKITLERVVVEAKPRKLRAEYSLEPAPAEGESFSDYLRRLSMESWRSGDHTIIHTEVYEFLENYKNHTPIQRFLWNLKWGFKDCLNNYRNWKGHMNGEDWDFWGILSGEETGYE